MTRYSSLASRLTDVLSLSRRPVALAASQQQPAGLAKFSGSVPSGCSFWRLAADGRSFYTEASDHYNCAIGCYTHSIALPMEREAELGATVEFMTSIGYIRPEEVPGIARFANSPKYMAYAPLAEATFAPEVVILVGPPRKVDAAAGSGDARRGPDAALAVCSSHVHGDSGCHGGRDHRVQRVRGQSCLHRPGR